MTDTPFAILGLTGGIASGKSTASAMLRERGARIIDADVIAREVVEPGQPAHADIREAFGEAVFHDDGTLDREALGAQVFGDANARARLNAITHPRIGQRMMQRANEARASGLSWVVYDAALIVENGIHEWLDSLIVVACSEQTQIARLMARDGIDAEAARARIDAQMPLADKLAVADYVIDNDGTLDQTRQQVAALYDEVDRRVAEHGTAKPEHTMSFEIR